MTDTIQIDAQTRNLARVRAFVRDTIGRSGLAGRALSRVVLAVDEAVSNTMIHGYFGRGGSVEVNVDVDSSSVRVTILDGGVPYDAARGSEASLEMDLQKHIESGARRGLGLFIMRKVMDEIIYTARSGQRNQLTLVKYIGEA